MAVSMKKLAKEKLQMRIEEKNKEKLPLELTMR
jgi:hypothetical protein